MADAVDCWLALAAWETDGDVLTESEVPRLPVDEDEAVAAWLRDDDGLDEDCCVGVELSDWLTVCA